MKIYTCGKWLVIHITVISSTKGITPKWLPWKYTHMAYFDLIVSHLFVSVIHISHFLSLIIDMPHGVKNLLKMYTHCCFWHWEYHTIFFTIVSCCWTFFWRWIQSSPIKNCYLQTHTHNKNSFWFHTSDHPPGCVRNGTRPSATVVAAGQRQ